MTRKITNLAKAAGVSMLFALTACGAASEEATAPTEAQPAAMAAPAQESEPAVGEAASSVELKNFSNAPPKADLPTNSSESMTRMESFDRARNNGESWIGDGLFTNFDTERKYLDRYPAFTDLQCQMSHGAKTFWCAHGRMGEDMDADVAKQVTFLYNEDVLAQQGEIACSQHLCITHEGLVAGALQPAMWTWMQEKCEFDDRNYFRCSV